MLQKTITIIRKENLHNPGSYDLDGLTELPVIKEMFKHWILNESLIPMAIEPVSEYLTFQKFFIDDIDIFELFP